MTQTTKRALIGLSVLGLALLAYRILKIRTGEEPPIRVKNGSIILRPDSGQWTATQGDSSDVSYAWAASEWTKGPFMLTVTVHLNPGIPGQPSGDQCADGVTVTGRQVKLVSDSDVEVTVKANTQHLKVRPKDTGILSNQNRVLTYGGEFVRSLEVTGAGKPFRCTFPSKAALDEITICTRSTCSK